jgi:hypothetical protein
MNLALSVFVGLGFALCLFTLIAIWFVPGFFQAFWRKATRPLGAVAIFGIAILFMGAVTQISLTTQVNGILPSANGGTGSAFIAFSGPTALRTYTGPDANATLLTSNTAVSVPQGGTGAGTFTNHGVLLGQGTSTLAVTAAGTLGQCFTSNGASADPTWQPCPGALNFSDNEVPTGTINGSTTAFTLAHAPNPAASLNCNENGVHQIAGGSDFTLATLTITYGVAPPTGSTLNCSYRY